MNTVLDVTLLHPHFSELQGLQFRNGSVESAAYLLLGVSQIAADPWTGAPRLRLVSHRYRDVAEEDKVSSSGMHVTWSTRGYMQLLNEALADDLVPAIIHTHPGSHAFFSEQDDRNEAELARTAAVKGARGLMSIVLGGDGSVCARLWRPDGSILDAATVQAVGGRYRQWRSTAAAAHGDYLDRQSRLFGAGFNLLLRSLRVAIIGCGGTGSPLALLLARLGVGHLLLVDNDRVELSNLNRLHGSRRSDADARALKVDVLEREILAMGLDVRVEKQVSLVGEAQMRDAVRACDFIFGCTDDHSGRIFLNRLAFFYGITVIDVGLRMSPASVDPLHDINGRVTTLFPGRPCLLCGKFVNPQRAAEEVLERTDPDEFVRRKAEAYVVGGGDPAPSVITFTTEMACVAANEMVAALTGFHGEDGMVPTRFRRFHALDDRFLAVSQREHCPVCMSSRYWGRADFQPFLDLIGAA